MNLSIGSDHAGFEYKNKIIEKLSGMGYSIKDQGCFSSDSVDYPDFVHPVALDVETGRADYGIVLCGSAIGVSVTVNKHQGIRGALCWQKEIAKLSRQHNDANIIAIPARFVALPLALEMIEVFLNTKFEGGRHQRRVDKISLNP